MTPELAAAPSPSGISPQFVLQVFERSNASPLKGGTTMDAEPTGLTQRELLDLFDRCEAHPAIRRAIRETLAPSAPAVTETDLRAAVSRALHRLPYIDRNRRRYVELVAVDAALREYLAAPPADE